MMYPKPKRKVDKALMREFHEMQCLLCNLPATPSHVKTRGSGGPDERFNLMPLCALHHAEWGQIGWKKFCKKYKAFEDELIRWGWEIGDNLWHPKL